MGVAQDKRDSLQKTNTKSPRIKKKGIKRAKGLSEDSIQDMTEKYLELKGIRYIHIPKPVYAMCGNLKTPQIVKNQISKYLRGIPDLVCFKGPTKEGNFLDNSSLLMELKKDVGKVSQGQSQWHKGLVVHVPRSFEECKKIIDAWWEG